MSWNNKTLRKSAFWILWTCEILWSSEVTKKSVFEKYLLLLIHILPLMLSHNQFWVWLFAADRIPIEVNRFILCVSFTEADLDTKKRDNTQQVTIMRWIKQAVKVEIRHCNARCRHFKSKLIITHEKLHLQLYQCLPARQEPFLWTSQVCVWEPCTHIDTLKYEIWDEQEMNHMLVIYTTIYASQASHHR